MQKIRNILLKSPPKPLKTCELPCNPNAERASLSYLRRSVDRTERTVPLSSNQDPSGKPGTIKKVGGSSARPKSPSISGTAGPGAGDSSAGDEYVSDLLKSNFLSSSSACTKLVDHIHQAGDLGTFSSLSLDKQKEAAMHLLQNGVVFAVEAIQNSSAVSPSSAKLEELMQKNADLTNKLSVERARYEAIMSEVKEKLFMLKRSRRQRDDELKSSAALLHDRKEAYFRLEHKYMDSTQSYDKLLAKFDAYREAAEESKYDVVGDAYKLGYLDCQNGILPCRPLEEANADEQAADEIVAEEEVAKDDATDEAEADEDETKDGAADEAEVDEDDTKDGVAGAGQQADVADQSESSSSTADQGGTPE